MASVMGKIWEHDDRPQGFGVFFCFHCILSIASLCLPSGKHNQKNKSVPIGEKSINDMYVFHNYVSLIEGMYGGFVCQTCTNLLDQSGFLACSCAFCMNRNCSVQHFCSRPAALNLLVLHVLMNEVDKCHKVSIKVSTFIILASLCLQTNGLVFFLRPV